MLDCEWPRRCRVGDANSMLMLEVDGCARWIRIAASCKRLKSQLVA